MNLSEIFYSIQGEGLLSGVPSVFVRFSGCPLRCVWCDTPYTSWSPEANEVSVEQVIEKVNAYDCRHVVITGGEPFSQPKPLQKLCDGLQSHHITVETAGIRFTKIDADLISISPKTANSIPVGTTAEKRHSKNRLKPDILRRFRAEYPNSYLKCVVRSESDIPEIMEIVEATGYQVSDVFLMPEGATPLQIEKHREQVVNLCKQYGFRYSARLHIDIWGKQRGV